MDGLMQPRPLTIAHLFERAETFFGHKHVVDADGTRTPYRAWARRVRRLAAALGALRVAPGARVATLAANHRRHLEVYAAVPISKRVLHTLNIRLPVEHLVHIIDHAGDDVVFLDRRHLPLIEACLDRLPGVRHWVVFPDGTDHALPDDARFQHYDDLLAASPPVEGSFEATFSGAEENLAAGLCYTSGTTGHPKGVLYSHRSTVLHCLGTLAAGLIGISERDVVLPVVPMFHANAWGLPYGALMAGADLVLPGASADPEHLAGLIQAHRVTVAAAVPTVWTGLLPALRNRDCSSLRFLLGGGSVVTSHLSAAYEAAIGIPITHSWGMTEVSPVGAIGGLRSQHDDLAPDARALVASAQGQPAPLVSVRIVDVDTGEPRPHDGRSVGELQVAGPWVAAGYVGGAGADTFTADGWLRTGDLASIDEHGYLRLVDRIKDLIKSGGEWISSVELEAAIATHPDVDQVAVVARDHPTWVERPVAFVVLRAGSATTVGDLRDHLSRRIASWWMPDDFILRDSIPLTGTGKPAKRTLRESLRTAAGTI
ncbi:long-chain-fatty-acid--CoA ligase [Actinoplanes sp. N902-109]|uniref:long-chain-fatty-acid--CoA ligase n=1 Tax=Actinoplanes sp. (strain N902-109) TaxID=649831 RepID=UPI000329582E|nr:long-chain-fatty-acid--CoA ligase [Actinoplanes sp. N902-109]AGL17520.1 fatty-acyl-CoA synthetase [Actinoplanes sp. N902-109]